MKREGSTVCGQRRRVALGLGLLAACLAAPPAAAQTLGDLARAARTTRESLFGSIEFEAGSFEGLPQWARVIAKMERIRHRFEACAADRAHCNDAVLTTWRGVLDAAQGRPEDEQLRAVNLAFNRWPYREDIEIYGVSEYWATPPEFISRSGDCEDFAISKLAALCNDRGWPRSALTLAACRLQNGQGHAVLLVHSDKGVYALDNRRRRVEPWQRLAYRWVAREEPGAPFGLWRKLIA